jgi:beta-N-acetylhexosaminidase
MALTLEQAIGQKMMWSFAGLEPTPDILSAIEQHRVGGLTLFRGMNISDPAQVCGLIETLQRAARQAHEPPLLIGADQEGGTLVAVPGTTRFPGNLALGATRSPDLAYRTGQAIGRELAAVGFNIAYAPVCDVINNALNPVVGPRSFGSNPQLVAQLAAAMVEGLQAAGMAAAAKHFPGHGDTSSDSHYGTPVSTHTAAQLHAIDLPPFAAAIRAGARLIMTGHIALPIFDGGLNLPATLSPRILRGLLRDELGFQGIIITDALDMRAIRQDKALVLETIIAARAGVDLLLLTSFTDQHGVYDGLLHAAQRDLLSSAEVFASADRIAALKQWCAQQTPPDLSVINCVEHAALAAEIARQSITLVRDEAQCLPLRLPSSARVAVVVPQPQDLTPADTSSYETPSLAAAIREYHPGVDEFIYPINPTDDDVAALREQLVGYDVIIAGTINATHHAGQAALINAIIHAGRTFIVVALRMPHDLSVVPNASTYICTYSLQAPSMTALAQALWGHIPFVGQLPVTLPD